MESRESNHQVSNKYSARTRKLISDRTVEAQLDSFDTKEASLIYTSIHDRYKDSATDVDQRSALPVDQNWVVNSILGQTISNGVVLPSSEVTSRVQQPQKLIATPKKEPFGYHKPNTSVLGQDEANLMPGNTESLQQADPVTVINPHRRRRTEFASLHTSYGQPVAAENLQSVHEHRISKSQNQTCDSNMIRYRDNNSKVKQNGTKTRRSNISPRIMQALGEKGTRPFQNGSAMKAATGVPMTQKRSINTAPSSGDYLYKLILGV